jgi:hypothetical protein
MWRTGYPISPLLNAVCFAWPATTLAVKHDASRLMARTISTVKSSVKRWLGSKPRHSGTGRDADELAGTTKDKISRKISSSRMMLNCDTIRFAVIDDREHPHKPLAAKSCRSRFKPRWRRLHSQLVVRTNCEFAGDCFLGTAFLTFIKSLRRGSRIAA